MNHDVVIVGGSYPSVKWIDGAVMEADGKANDFTILLADGPFHLDRRDEDLGARRHRLR